MHLIPFLLNGLIISVLDGIDEDGYLSIDFKFLWTDECI